MVEARDHVLMIFRSRVLFIASIFFIRLGSTNQPFFVDLDIASLLPLLLPPPHDHGLGLLVSARPVAHGRLAPWGLRLAANRRPTLATAMRVIDRVHHRAAHRGPPAHPARPTR